MNAQSSHYTAQQLLKQGAAIMSRKQRDSTSYSGAFEVRLRIMSRHICDEQELLVSADG